MKFACNMQQHVSVGLGLGLGYSVIWVQLMLNIAYWFISCSSPYNIEIMFAPDSESKLRALIIARITLPHKLYRVARSTNAAQLLFAFH